MLKNVLTAIRCKFPAACIVCGKSAENEYQLCECCENSLPRLGICCLHCGVELRGMLSRHGICGGCLRSPPSFQLCRAARPYSPPINKLLSNFKFSARFEIGYSLSRILCDSINSFYAAGNKPELLLPVPLHSSRLRSRGFNQAYQICKVISKHCRIPVETRALIKHRRTEPQISMPSASARKSNLRAAFVLKNPELIRHVTHFALVDDVVTTMATVEALSGLLLEQKTCRVDVWCLARASH